jgi:hypothetical protein
LVFGSSRFRGEIVAIRPQLSATIACVSDEHAQPLEQQLEEIGSRLAWVRDYL